MEVRLIYISACNSTSIWLFYDITWKIGRNLQTSRKGTSFYMLKNAIAVSIGYTKWPPYKWKGDEYEFEIGFNHV